jgi:serine/threonine-protein kinase RsbW
MSAEVDTSVLRLTLPARPEHLMFTRLVLTGLSRTVEIEAEALADLKLAVSEACSYLIRSGVPEGGRLAISYQLSEEEIGVAVAVEETQVVDLAAAESVEGDEDDLGLAIIHALADEVEIGADPAGRVAQLTFRKRLVAAPA